MDVTKILEADHREVEELLDRLAEIDGPERAPLIDQLTTAVKGHMELEESVLYPAMRPVTGDEAVEEGENEHDVVRSALDEVVNLGPDEPGFGAALEALQAAITHHVDEEEGEVFPELRRDAQSVLDELASRFLARREELGLPLTADAMSAAASKAELVDQAERRGVDGPGAMKKAELAETLTTDSP